MPAFVSTWIEDTTKGQFQWKRGEHLILDEEAGRTAVVLGGVRPKRVRQEEGKPIYLLSAAEDTYFLAVQHEEGNHLCEIHQSVIDGLGSGQPRGVLNALVHLADCGFCITGLALIADALPNSPSATSPAEMLRRLGEKLLAEEEGRLADGMATLLGRSRKPVKLRVVPGGKRSEKQ